MAKFIGSTDFQILLEIYITGVTIVSALRVFLLVLGLWTIPVSNGDNIPAPIIIQYIRILIEIILPILPPITRSDISQFIMNWVLGTIGYQIKMIWQITAGSGRPGW